MGSLKLNLQRNKRIEDITLEPFEYEYPQEQEVAGHRFTHIAYGIYRADPEFALSRRQLGGILPKYCDLVLGCRKMDDGTDVEVLYAYSKECVTLDDPYRQIFNKSCVREELKPYRKVWMTPQRIIREETFDKSRKRPASWKKVMRYLLPEDTMEIDSSDDMKAVRERLPKRICLNGVIGEMVEEGIYHFSPAWGNQNDADKVPVWNLNDYDLGEAAVIYHFSRYCSCPYDLDSRIWIIWINFLAVDRKYYPRLREIYAGYAAGTSYYGYQELEEIWKNREEDEKEPGSEDAEWTDREEPVIIDRNEDIPIEEGAEELVEGLGFYDISLTYSIPRIKKSGHFAQYGAAYKLGDELVLVQTEYRERIVDGKTVTECFPYTERHDMKLMDTLYIQEPKWLRCGQSYFVIYRLIDCREQSGNMSSPILK